MKILNQHSIFESELRPDQAIWIFRVYSDF